MAADPALIAHLRDLFAGLGPIVVRPMFSGAGLYLGDAMFGLVARDAVYLRTDATTRPAFEAAGARVFAHEMQGRRRELPAFMTLPDAALDDPDAAMRWAALALPAARAAAEEKRRARSRKAEKAHRRR